MNADRLTMNLEEKLRHLKRAAQKNPRDRDLEAQLEYLRRLEQPAKKLPAQRAPHQIEEYVEGRVQQHAFGEFFVAEQSLPFGRPYGTVRIGDVAAADLAALNLFLEGQSLPEASRLVYLDTETTGLVGDAGTCAFLIGIGTVEGAQFVVRQFFLREYTEEKAVLAALAEALDGRDGLVTFNGKAFDVPLLETRYTLARLCSPFSRLLHLDLLHPARRLWKLRVENCQLTNLERHVLGIEREGDVPGSEIPAIYFDYLRTGDARGLQPVFFHNALDIISTAALAVEMAHTLRAAQGEAPAASQQSRTEAGLDLFSLSRIFERAGATDVSLATCRKALAAGLPEPLEPRALWHLAVQHKRRREFEAAVEIWRELSRRPGGYAVEAYRELAIHFEHRRR
ncbi:MAG TPA: ribonuclease H-like domain-containing protein, partial [Terriglobia bacterium]|nr:ribonuclease H-like domain-containing protein [Terriglobia bacterium]